MLISVRSGDGMYRLPAVYRGRLAYKGRGRKPQIIREVNEMREGIHPNYYQAKVVCNCGNEFVTGSTKQDIHVEVCSKCHSFYTGQQKAAAARGRIDKFNRKYGMNAN